MFRKYFFILLFCILCSAKSYAGLYAPDTVKLSLATDAIQYLNSIKKLDKSIYWPNIDPQKFLENLKTFTVAPLEFYEGKSTNFCGYSVLTYIPLRYDPLGFAKKMIHLYQYGEVHFGKVWLKPGDAVRNEAGMIRYKGFLDVNPAGQMWFMTLADHFKGYINILNRRFDKGDENTLWASTNYAKFNRMLRKLFDWKIESKGSDLIQPRLKDLVGYITGQMKKGLVFVYLDNTRLYKNTHTRSYFHTATHYIMLTDIIRLDDGDVEFVYRDYGKKTLQKLSPEFLENIVYGITTFPFRNYFEK